MKYTIILISLILTCFIDINKVQAETLNLDEQFITEDTVEYKRPHTGRSKKSRYKGNSPIRLRKI